MGTNKNWQMGALTVVVIASVVLAGYAGLDMYRTYRGVKRFLTYIGDTVDPSASPTVIPGTPKIQEPVIQPSIDPLGGLEPAQINPQEPAGSIDLNPRVEEFPKPKVQQVPRCVRTTVCCIGDCRIKVQKETMTAPMKNTVKDPEIPDRPPDIKSEPADIRDYYKQDKNGNWIWSEE